MDKHSFKSIFGTEIVSGTAAVRIRNIEIPSVQRDYAQGRAGNDVARIRTRILEALRKAVTGTPLTLDFIYGDVDSNGNMTPIDGQQRLTLLFLLHWYASRRDAIADADCEFLRHFTYATRPASRQFCEKLVSFRPSLHTSLSQEIADQEWFPLGWQADPTASSMLVVLDDIQNVFADVPDLWEALCSGAITFHFLPIRDMGLTDELYVKMNSRGKPLTTFEHFKAELERSITATSPSDAIRISKKIDGEWTDMFWSLGKSAEFVDNAFLNYFRFVCDILCYKMHDTPQGKNRDPFTLQETYFGSGSGIDAKNLEFLEKSLNCWVTVKRETTGGTSEFFRQFYDDSRLITASDSKFNYLMDCLTSYERLPFSKKVILYAFSVYLLNKSSIEEASFRERIRIVRNLVENSRDEMSDSEIRQGGNRMPAVIEQVDSIILHGIVADNLSINFNDVQLDEERMKIVWRKDNPQWVDALRNLEDHPLLYGRVGILDLAKPELFQRFAELFSCSWDKVDCALISIGDYWQADSNGWRWQGGTSNQNVSSAWKSLFHKGPAGGFDNTVRTLGALLASHEKFDDETLDEIVGGFLKQCKETHRFDWRYYYAKYPSFRPGRHGKFCLDGDRMNAPYVFRVMWTPTNISENTYSAYLKEADSEHISRESYGDCLVYHDKKIYVTNQGFRITDISGKETIDLWNVPQVNGIDQEDRIVFLKQHLAQCSFLK